MFIVSSPIMRFKLTVLQFFFLGVLFLVKSGESTAVAPDDDVCDFNKAGRMCGGCKENYSLAIGSSHCIHCPNNNNLALLIFFAAAGVLLVLFIGALNLTVSVGMFNGVIFYANMIWIYKDVLFPERDSSSGLQFLKTFIAWLNLDFGIETCFVQGLNAFSKTWLQFLFPFYIWIISVAIIVCCRYSSRLTKIFGDRGLPILATLLCLSYVKLIRTIIDGMAFNVYHDNSTRSEVVWSLDGNLLYGRSPHIFLLLAVIAALLFLWGPYTFVLIFTQWCRKYSYRLLCRWTILYKPFYDCQFACLKDKHHYWHGTLLLTRALLLIIYSFTSLRSPTINILILQLSSMLILIYEVYTRLYRERSVQIVHASILLNLAILGSSVLYAELVGGQKTVAIILSVSVVLIQFWGLIFWNIATAVRPFIFRKWNRYHEKYDSFESTSEGESIVEKHDQSSTNNSVYFNRFRDSIFDDMQSLEIPTV